MKNQTKNTATIGKLSKAVYASYVYVCIVQGGQVVWTAAGGLVIREECVWAVCVCIWETGGGGQLN
jgi:hypothetical protein